MPVFRVDAVRISGVSTTPAGGLRIPATPCRTGVLTYKRGGKTIREYRPPEEVFHADSLASLKAAAVTVGHPAQQTVDPRNWAQLSVGFVSDKDPVRTDIDGEAYPQTDVIVQRADTIDAVRAEKLIELSAGYMCDTVDEPGVAPNGERYDCVQRNIRYNHVALLPPGQARAGKQARLRLDSNEDVGMTEKIRVDGVECEFGSQTHIELLEKAHAAAVSRETLRADAAEKQLGELSAKLDSAQAEIKALREDSADEKIAAMIALREQARRFLPADYSFSGKSAHKIRVDALVSAGCAADKLASVSESWVEGNFYARCDEISAQPQSAQKIDYGKLQGNRSDSEEKQPANITEKLAQISRKRFDASFASSEGE